MTTKTMNFGKLKGATPEQNIVYYRRGQDELSLNITNACPNACVFCIRDRNPGWGVSNLYLERDPTTDEIIEAFDINHNQIQQDGVKLAKVKICGYGEPVLRTDDLPPILQHIRSRSDTQIQLTTTGWPYFRHISPDVAKLQELVTSGLTHVYLSMSAPDQKTYNRLVRPGIDKIDQNAFQDALRFGTEARGLGLDVTLGFINLNGVNHQQAIDLATRLGLKYKIREMEE